MIVNVYHPSFWTNHGHWKYLNQTPGNSGIWNSISYRINPQKLSEADFVVVHEDIDHTLKAKVQQGGVCLVTGEEKSIKKSYQQDYLDQFDFVITSRDDISHPHVMRCHYMHPWWVDKSYDELMAINHPIKTNQLSAIISNLAVSPTHKDRFAFINKLKGHYKDDLDWFAKGEKTFLADKWDGLAPYHYSIAIENSYYTNYFTEKITDCFLAYTMPFYAGCPNINEFFDDRSFVKIDIHDFQKSIHTIDEAMGGQRSKKNQSYIRESRALVLEKYHFLAALSDILKRKEKTNVTVRKTLHPQNYFDGGKVSQLIKLAKRKFRFVKDVTHLFQ
jgi:hypothetical protein